MRRRRVQPTCGAIACASRAFLKLDFFICACQKLALDLAWIGAAWIPSSTYSSGFVVTAYLQITATCSMAQSPALWKPAKMLGCIDWTKLDYISFVAFMVRVDGSCSARTLVSG
jgi:hypothetical protein